MQNRLYQGYLICIAILHSQERTLDSQTLRSKTLPMKVIYGALVSGEPRSM